MGNADKNRLPRTAMPSNHSNIDRPQRRKRSDIAPESIEAEQSGVLPHECTRVKDAISRSVTTVTSLTEIGEAVWLMKSLGVGAVIACRGSTLFGTLSGRDSALAIAPPSEPIHTVMTPDPVYCYENDLLHDVHAMMRACDLTALPVRDFHGLFSGIVMRTV
jgi:CBS domain-containing protein